MLTNWKSTIFLRRLPFSFVLCSTLLFTSAAVVAQTSGDAGYGGIGDPAIAPGSPPSSYDLSAIDHINYYSGLVNVTIPVYTVGGRGPAAVPLVIGLQRQWTVSTPNSPYTSQTEYPITFFGPGGTGTPTLQIVGRSAQCVPAGRLCLGCRGNYHLASLHRTRRNAIDTA